MSGPRAGFSGIIVRSRDVMGTGGEVERLGSEVSSDQVHRSCQQGSDCKGPGCRVRTGKTAGTLADARLWRLRSELSIARRENTTRAAMAKLIPSASHAA